MQVDKTTLQDLSIIHADEEQSVFYHLNNTQTNGGREYLRYILSKPLDTLAAITDTQLLIKQLIAIEQEWPVTITNGTIMVVERFFETQINFYPSHPTVISSYYYKIINAADYSITKYSVEHSHSLLKGFWQILNLLNGTESKQLQTWLEHIALMLQRPFVQELLQYDNPKKLTPRQVLYFANHLRFHFKQQLFELIDIYNRLDAYLSLAVASKKFQFSFPVITETEKPLITAEALYHLQLKIPVSYNVELTQHKNFLFLTGANMAGKSTFIKATGIAVYLAHLGMSVPAKNMQLSLFDGLLSNIHVVDNILKGESYFFNEVQRIKKTVEKINDGKKWLILIDELFKGTNVQDAMKCSTTVIEGLRKMQNVLFVLSTHLYEIGDDLKKHSNIQFKYFETSIKDDELEFSYQLKEGISNDRLGYLILRKEGVVEMLEKL
ncbi:MAG: DNA mismatch repair protein MutS [Chitinophaga sp.]|jgi:DNA mismatch repair protein MutS|nr:DNA mismatch repair protein MutS [Chitinophaga sp.]